MDVVMIIQFIFSGITVNSRKQLIMNNIQCPCCNQTYSFANPPKKLKNCSHSICDSCLPTAPKCPLDNKRVDFRRYTARAFEINHELLDLLDKSVESPKKTKPPHHKQSSPKKEYEMCLLHSKPAEIICYVDGSLICASCALFGEHRGHAIKNCEQFLNNLTSYTEQALQVFDKLKEKEENLNETIVSQYIDDCFKEQKNQEMKNIKAAFAKLMEKIKKAQKSTLARLDNQIKLRKEALLKEVSIQELESKKNQWYKEVQNLGNITQGAYEFRTIPEALRYLDQKDSESFLLKRGEYLYLEYSSSQNLIKNKIDTETAKLVTVVNEQIDRTIDQYCTFAGSLERKESTPCTRLKQSNVSVASKKQEEDILIDQIPHTMDLSNSQYRKDIYLRPEVQNRSGYVIGIKIPEVTIAESVQHMEQSYPKQQKQKNEKLQRSKSSRQKSVVDFNMYPNRQVLGPVENRKRKKIDMPQKYKQVFEDLKNDRCEVIDFGGAELGDQNVLALCQYIQKTNKLRNLKLVRNKISDDVVKQILNACFCAKVTSLNLGQNLLTQKSLEMLEAFDLGQLRNITLSLNKINRRNVKGRLQDFVKRGITLSV